MDLWSFTNLSGLYFSLIPRLVGFKTFTSYHFAFMAHEVFNKSSPEISTVKIEQLSSFSKLGIANHEDLPPHTFQTSNKFV